MGVYTSFCTVYGIQLPYSVYGDLWDKFDNSDISCDQLNELCIADSMGGTYAVFGHKFVNCNGYEDSAFEVIDITKLEEYKKKYLDTVAKDLPELLPYLLDCEWKLYSFTHYS